MQQPDDENEAEKADDEVDDEADPADPPVVPEPPEPLEPAKIPFHLGRLLLTASRVRQPYQVIAIIGLDPRPEQAPDPDKED